MHLPFRRFPSRFLIFAPLLHPRPSPQGAVSCPRGSHRKAAFAGPTPALLPATPLPGTKNSTRAGGQLHLRGPPVPKPPQPRASTRGWAGPAGRGREGAGLT